MLSLLLIALLRPALALPPAGGLSCPQHPAYFSGLRSVLLRSWHLDGMRESTFTANYHPRHSEHLYAPRNDLSSTKWANFDWFWTMRSPGNTDRYARLDLQRPARLYILVGVRHDNSYPSARLSGWRSEGHAELTKGRGKMLRYGVHQFGYRMVQPKVYIFSKVFGTVAWIPHHAWLVRNVEGVEVAGDVMAMIGEANGDPPIVPKNPPGIRAAIVPGKPCPDELHDRWVAKNTDDKDEDTKGKTWKTWHPAWDPCYWCAYDHEHGSSPYHLMGYHPKFDYTAWKNKREVEPNEGFKSIVFRNGDYFVCIGIHVQTSHLRRVYERHHSISLVIVRAATKKIVVELHQKADYGFSSTRAKGGGFFPLTAEDRTEMERQLETGDLIKRRSVNVINQANLDNRFDYREPASARMLGLYEDWTTAPLCAKPGKHAGLISVDIKQAATGIRSLAQKDVKVHLGSFRGNKFYRSTGSPRLLKLNNFVVSYDACMFRLEDIFNGKSHNGEFYTDAYGSKLYPGPGKYLVRQFIEPGFRMRLDGRYETKDSWYGLHGENVIGEMADFGFGLDPDKN